MDKLVFMDMLNEKLFEHERIFKLNSATLHNNKIVKIILIAEVHAYDKYLNDELMQKMENIVREILPDIFDFEIIYRKTYTEEKYVLKSILDFVYTEYPTIFSFFQTAKIDIEIKGSVISADIYVEKYIYDFCIANEVGNAIKTHLESCFMEEAEVRLIKTPNKTEITIGRQDYEEEIPIKVIDISITAQLLGPVGNRPRYISEVKGGEVESMTLCGVVTKLKKLSYKRRNKEAFFYVFTLNDTTSVIDVKFFPRNKKADEVGELLSEGDKLVIQGSLTYDNYTNSIVMYANKIARCEINYDSIDTKPVYKKEKDRYITVAPKQYLNEEQKSLFADISKESNAVFYGKSYVVFDLETTGTGNYDKITEIGAIKIVDGEFTEIFHTLVNPEMPIPEEVFKLTGINYDMVKDAPKFGDVVADFYKFTRGSILVAQNASFDMGFLDRMGKKEHYLFDNTVVDTMVLAKQKLSLNNYKLKTICKALNVELNNAHRAMSDAIATAHVFKKLMLMNNK